MYEKALTLLSTTGGCAAKIEPAILQQILTGLKVDTQDEAMSIHYKEDIGVISLPDKQRLAQSIDMITPVSDDPRTFGAIAAAHALSDLYAKGTSPLSGLLLLGLPALLVSPNTAIAILQGAIDKLHEAGAKFLGGHTLASQELQLGVTVTGLIEDKFIPNTGCQIGDLLVLTKPLGTGIVVTALKLKNAGVTSDNFSHELLRISEQSMLSLNNVSAHVMKQIGVNACTDITGFGLLGHLSEMLNDGNLSACIHFDEVPFFPGVAHLASQDIISTGGERNAAFYWKDCVFTDNLTYAQKMLLFDPQTSGGLLISVSQDKGDLLMRRLRQQGVDAAIIGQITQKDEALIHVV